MIGILLRKVGNGQPWQNENETTYDNCCKLILDKKNCAETFWAIHLQTCAEKVVY